MGEGKRKQNFQKPTSSLVKTPPCLPTQYNFTPASTSAPPVNVEPRPPSVKDYPPPMQLFTSSSVARPRGASPSPPSHAPPARKSQVPPSEASPRSLSEPSVLPPSQPPLEPPSQASLVPPSQPSILPQSQQSSPPLRTSHSPHSSHAQNEDAMDEDFSDCEPDLSDNQLASLNYLLQQPRSKHITFLDPNRTEPDSTW